MSSPVRQARVSSGRQHRLRGETTTRPRRTRWDDSALVRFDRHSQFTRAVRQITAHFHSHQHQVGLVLFEMVHGPLPYDDDTYLDRTAKRELRELAASGSGIGPFDRNQIVNRSLERAASGKGVTAFGKLQPYVPRSLVRIINKAIARDPVARYQKPSDMIGHLEALRLPGWQSSPCGRRYVAHGWYGCDWSVEPDPKKPGQWVVFRRRQAATNFRRWAKAQNAPAACRRVTEVAT